MHDRNMKEQEKFIACMYKKIVRRHLHSLGEYVCHHQADDMCTCCRSWQSETLLHGITKLLRLQCWTASDHKEDIMLQAIFVCDPDNIHEGRSSLPDGIVQSRTHGLLCKIPLQIQYNCSLWPDGTRCAMRILPQACNTGVHKTPSS